MPRTRWFSSFPLRRFASIVSLFIVSFAVLALAINTPANSKPILNQPPDTYSASKTIDVGIHIKNIYNLSLKEKTFKADGWFWLKWPKEVQTIIDREKINLLSIVEFPNMVDPWDSQIELDGSEPTITSTGKYFQGYSESENP